MPEQMRSDIARLDDRYDRLKTAVVVCLAGVVLAILLALVFNYRGRVDQHDATVASCEAAKIDRAKQANAWFEALNRARTQAHDPGVSNQNRVVSAHASRVYASTVRRFANRAERSELNPRVVSAFPSAGRYRCGDAFPNPSFLPLGSSEAR